MADRELCGDISLKGAMCVLYAGHRCQCAGPPVPGRRGRERWWSTIKRPGNWPVYIGQQVADWFTERGLVPCVVQDVYNPTVGVLRIHGSVPGRRLTRLCLVGGAKGQPLRRATLQDMCSWLPCRRCTTELAYQIATNRWPPERAEHVRRLLREGVHA